MSYFDSALTKRLKENLLALGVQNNDYPSLVRLYYVVYMLHKHFQENPRITFSAFSNMLNGEEFLLILATVDVPPFSTSRSKKLFDLFNLVREHGLELHHARFFRLVAPALVADWAGFSAKFSNSDKENLLLVLYHVILRVYRASGTSAVFSENPNKIVEDMLNIDLLDDYSREFLEDCVRNVLYIELLHLVSHPKPKSKFVRSLSDAINRINTICDEHDDITAHDCILRYIAAQELTMYEDLNKELKRFRKVTATDVLWQCAPWEPQEDILAVRFVLMRFFEILEEKMLIYNPLPAMLGELQFMDKGIPEELSFVVPDILEAQAYHQQFPAFSIYGGDTLPENFQNILIIDSDGNLPYEHLLHQLKQCCNSADFRLLIYASQSKIPQIHKLLEESGFYIDMILGIPTGIAQNKKSLIYGSTVCPEVIRLMEAERNVQQGRGKTGLPFLEVNALYISRKYVEVPREWLNHGWTIKQMIHMKQNAEINDHTKYAKAKIHAWSQEIIIFYAVYEREKDYLEGRAYVKSVSFQKGELHYGKRIGARVQGLRGKSVDEILEKLPSILFEPEIYREYVPVLEKLHENSTKGLSLKTIWFMLWEDLNMLASYDNSVCYELFCGECQDLSNINPETATTESILEALISVCGIQKIPERYLKQLCLIFKLAVDQKFLTENKLKTAITYVRQQESEWENVLSRNRKRTVTDTQIKRIMMKLLEMKGGYPLYASDSKIFFMAISLFAPISLVKLRALKWRDIFRSSDLCVINISKKMTREGREEDIDVPHCVPCAPIIDMLIQTRLEYLERECGISTSMIAEQYVFWEDDPTSASDLKHKMEPISHPTAKRIQNEMVEIAEIQSSVTRVTGGGKSRPFYFNKPNLKTFWCNNAVTKSALVGLELGEIKFILGEKPSDTVDAHYFGFEAPYNLMRMAAIQHRWTAPYEAMLKSAGEESWNETIVDSNIDVFSGRDLGKRSYIWFEITTEERGGKVRIEIESEFGHDGNINQI